MSFATAFCVALIWSVAESSVVVETSGGLVKGKSEVTSLGTGFTSFRSIPYAKPPVGQLRFRPSEPADPWDGVLDATEDGQPCLQIPQLTEEGVIGSEDCLWLSVFTPVRSFSNSSIDAQGSNFPVLFWIHGGRALVGSARESFYSPSAYVMDEGDIVVVSVQYRLGALGFLSSGDAAAPGNYAMHDQVLALRWVKQNIGAFGGDPSRVTLVGQSVGGASASGHLFSPLSRGLFHGVVSMSGTANMAWASRFTRVLGPRKSLLQAELVGCPGSDGTMASSTLMIECLRGVDAEELTRSQSDLHSHFRRSTSKIPLSTYMMISPEPPTPEWEPFWPKDPREALRDRDYASDIPWLNGVTSLEGAWYSSTLFGKESRLAEFNDDREQAFYMLTSEEFFTPEEHSLLYSFYLGDRNITGEDALAFAELISDYFFTYESLHAAYLHSRVPNSAPFYQYRFDYRGDMTVTKLFDPTRDYGGVVHLDDLQYFMKPGFAPKKPSDADLSMARRYTGYIAQFVRSGRPSAHADDWPRYEPGHGVYMIIDGDDTRLSGAPPFPKARMDIWRKLHHVEEDILEDFTSAEKVEHYKQEL